jgi:hypothetical protein
VQEPVEVCRDEAGTESVADGIRQHNASIALVAAGKQRIQIAALAASRRQGDHVALQAGQLHVAMGPLVAGVELRSAERLRGGVAAMDVVGHRGQISTRAL